MIVAFLSGGAAGSIITLIWTGCRDKKNRRRVFIGFLKEWKSEIHSAVIPGDYPYPSISAYMNKVSSFKNMVEQVRDIFSDRQTFDTLTNKVAGLTEKDWVKKQPRDVICGAIDELIQFVEK